MIIIKIPLIFHIEKTNNKIAPNKFVKINNQAIYNGSLNRFGRAIVMENLHNYISVFLPKKLKNLEIKKRILINYKLRTVINHGDIRLVKGKTSWKKPNKATYQANWDLDNLMFIWIKAFNDTLVKNKAVLTDSVGVIVGTNYEFEEVEDLESAELEISIQLKLKT